MKNELYDSKIFICYITDEFVRENLKSGFIKKVKGFKNKYQTDMNFLKDVKKKII